MKSVYLTIFCLFFSCLGFCRHEAPVQFDYPESKIDSIKILNFESLRAFRMNEVTNYQLITESNLQKIKYLKYNEERYRWHGTTSTIIFFVVISIVISGLIFSGIQFFKSLNLKQTRVTQPLGQNQSAPNQNNETEQIQTIKISLTGIEVASSVFGVIILVISIAFFYLYLSEVYPLNIDGEKKADSKIETLMTK